MSDGIFSISLSTNTLVETHTTSVTTTKINSVNNVSSDETPGTSSSYYSTSSASSSAENISTVENGELSVFTFICPGHSRSSSNLLTEDLSSSASSASSSASCRCSCHHPSASLSYLCSDSCSSHCHLPHQRSYGNYGSNGGYSSAGSFSIDPFRLDGSHMYTYKGARRFQNHVLSDNYVRLLPRVSDGVLLRSLEKGVLYPVVHWSSKTNENLAQHTQLGHSVVFNQGVYKELKRVIPPDVWLTRDSSSTCSSARRSTWLIIGYKSLEKTLDSALEATWKEWTGVRHIYLNLRHDFEIRKISFLSRVHPQDNLDLFMYLVLMEIGNVDDSNLIWLLDFVQRTRVERMKGFITVYTETEPELPTIDDEYMKYISISPSGSSTKSKSHSSKEPSPQLVPPAASSSSSSSSSSDVLPIVDATLELNGNLKFIEKLLEEIHQPPIPDYF